MSVALEPTRFDYAKLPADVAQEARDLAERLHTYQRRTVADGLALGVDLLRMKERIEHGQFGAWLEAEFPQDPRTAQRLMQAAGEFAGKTDTLSYLPMTTVYALSAPSVPVEARSEIVQAIETDRLPPREISSRLSAAKRDAAHQRREAKKTEERKKRERLTREQRERRMARDREQFYRDQEAVEAARQDLRDFLRSELGDRLPLLIEKLRPARMDWGLGEMLEAGA